MRKNNDIAIMIKDILLYISLLKSFQIKNNDIECPKNDLYLMYQYVIMIKIVILNP